MYPQNDEINVLEVLQIKTFFATQLQWTDLLRIFVKFSQLNLQRWSLSKDIEKKDYLDTWNLWGEIRNCKKYNIPCRSVQWNNQFKPVATNT